MDQTKQFECLIQELEHIRSEREVLMRNLSTLMVNNSDPSMVPMCRLVNLIRIDLMSVKEMVHCIMQEAVINEAKVQAQKMSKPSRSKQRQAKKLAAHANMLTENNTEPIEEGFLAMKQEEIKEEMESADNHPSE